MTSLKRPHHLQATCEECGTTRQFVVLLHRTQSPPGELIRECPVCEKERQYRVEESSE